MMSGVAIIVLDINRMRFTDDMALRWKHLGKSIPIICIESTVGQMLHLVVESPEGCSITTAEHPGHSSPAATVNGFDDPKLVFFRLI